MVVAYKLLINIHFLARQGFSAMRRLVHRLSRRFGKLTDPTWRNRSKRRVLPVPRCENLRLKCEKHSRAVVAMHDAQCERQRF
jgi:hypothetical protein